MNERKTKGLTNLNSDEKNVRETCVSLARMYFSQFAAISCFNVNEFLLRTMYTACVAMTTYRTNNDSHISWYTAKLVNNVYEKQNVKNEVDTFTFSTQRM